MHKSAKIDGKKILHLNNIQESKGWKICYSDKETV